MQAVTSFSALVRQFSLHNEVFFISSFLAETNVSYTLVRLGIRKKNSQTHTYYALA